MQANYLKTTHLFFVMTNLFVICTLPVFLSLVLTYLETDIKPLSKYWALQYQFEDERYKTIVCLVGEYMFRTVRMQYPCVVVLSICVLLYRYSLLLLRLKNSFKIMEFITIPENIMKLGNDYNKIEKKLLVLKDALSTPLFIILLICFCDLYVTMYLVLQKKMTLFLWIELYCNTFSGIVILFSLTIYSAKIPEYMMGIKTTVGFLRDKYEFGSVIRGKEWIISTSSPFFPADNSIDDMEMKTLIASDSV
ncbi:uncharacterized protein NPIL_242711 [Nephila pilipes]|uniref:Uncharacterized protein n=1 Tax=Nephila pilipes TaxID=299642 RepID=A0A8X6U1L5_NEPPI|nr:uncharacterized protein NPIL_242711 [Nephila pilipes]